MANRSFSVLVPCTGNDVEKRRIFTRMHRQILNRVNRFVNLPPDVLDRTAIKRGIDAIGASPAAAS